MNAFEASFRDKTSAFLEFKSRPAENPVPGDDGGCYFNYSVKLKPDIVVKTISEQPPIPARSPQPATGGKKKGK